MRQLVQFTAVIFGSLLVINAMAGSGVDVHSEEYQNVRVPKDFNGRASDIMLYKPKLEKISDEVYVASGTGNAFLVKTPEGNVIFDTGVPWQGEALRELLLFVGHEKTTHIIVSHAHGDHMGGLTAWQQEINDGAEIIAHSRYPYTNKIYGDTDVYLWQQRTASIYPSPGTGAAEMVRQARAIEPTRLVYPDHDYSFTVGGVEFVVIAMQGGAEGEDNLVLWLPEQEVAFTGDLFGPLYPMVPNLYTVRGEKLRDPLAYIDALDRMIELEPSIMLPSHFGAVKGKNYIHKSLTVTRDGTEYVYKETVKGMNEGKSVYELMESVRLPESLEISQGHGKTSWNVRAIWELLAGWFYFDTVADLYSVPVSAVYADIVELVDGPDKLIASAERYASEGDNLKAIRLLDIAQGAGQETTDAIKLRVKLYSALIEESKDTHSNVSLDDILEAALRSSNAELKKRADK